MGNSIGGRKRTAKVMKIDGTILRFKPPAQAGDILRTNPGHVLMLSDEVKHLGLRAGPLDPDTALKPGKLYFLVELPKIPDQRAPRRAWSGAIHVSAKDRLESLMLSRRTASDLSLARPAGGEEGAVRLRMRLPKAQVEKLVQESRDSAEAAEKIMELCVAREGTGAALQPRTTVVGGGQDRRKEKRTRFVQTGDEIIAL